MMEVHKTKLRKSARQMERHLKGISNHRRIEILLLVAKNDGLGLEDIAERLDVNLKTLSEHSRRLAIAGLIDKKYKGRKVVHSLSPYGKIMYQFLTSFSHS